MTEEMCIQWFVYHTLTCEKKYVTFKGSQSQQNYINEVFFSDDGKLCEIIHVWNARKIRKVKKIQKIRSQSFSLNETQDPYNVDANNKGNNWPMKVLLRMPPEL